MARCLVVLHLPIPLWMVTRRWVGDLYAPTIIAQCHCSILQPRLHRRRRLRLLPAALDERHARQYATTLQAFRDRILVTELRRRLAVQQTFDVQHRRMVSVSSAITRNGIAAAARIPPRRRRPQGLVATRNCRNAQLELGISFNSTTTNSAH